jgi:hypothetical protein
VPDGALLAPHHFLWGLYLTVLACLVVWDNQRHREPLATMAGVGIALFGWLHVWNWYPVLGAGLAVAGTIAATLAVLLGRWEPYPDRWRWTALGGLAVALDDLASHALGWWTPLDWLWVEHVARLVA